MKLSRTAREAIKTSIFLIVVALLIVTYVVYPLMKTKTLMGRQNIEDFNNDSLMINDPSFYENSGFAPDTFRVETDGLTTIAGLFLNYDSVLFDVPKGTIFLLHSDKHNRDSMLTLAQLFHEAGYNVVAYDQRASGLSNGKYHADGQFEAEDLNAIISYLNLREKIYYPLTVVGYRLGGDAAILGSQSNPHISGVVAIDPYLTTFRQQDILIKEFDLIWFPLHRTILWFWYSMRSSYAIEYREIENLRPVLSPTLIYFTESFADDEEIIKFQSLSESNVLEIKTLKANETLPLTEIFSFIDNIKK